LLGGTEEPLLDGHLACDLPGLVGGDALAVACAVRAPCVAAVAMVPLALILVVRLPSAVIRYRIFYAFRRGLIRRSAAAPCHGRI
jgi:hypothetical protein